MNDAATESGSLEHDGVAAEERECPGGRGEPAFRAGLAGAGGQAGVLGHENRLEIEVAVTDVLVRALRTRRQQTVDQVKSIMRLRSRVRKRTDPDRVNYLV